MGRSDRKGRQVRVLFVNTARGLGGGVTSAVELAQGLARRGHELTVACHPRSGIHAALQGQERIRLARLPVRAELNPWRLMQLARIAQRAEPEVVLADRRKDVKLAVAVSRLMGGHRLPVVHRHGAPSLLRNSATYKAVWTRLRLLIVNSQWMHSALLEATPWLAQVPMQIIHNGKDPAYYRPRPEVRAEVRSAFGLDTEAFVICYHGVLQERKRVDVLLEAVAALRARGGIHALIVGDGPDADALERAAQGLPVTFAGRQDDIPRVLSAADAAVHMSEAEGFSNAVLEAMACGLPVIASRATSHPEQVVEGETGYLVDPGDGVAVAERISRLASDLVLARALGSAGRLRLLERFTIDAMLSDYEMALGQAAAGPR
jgi:glycosyltransferase involved in cell wall biosynthesis